jgi:ABC-2 type transport system ATP-binding protein
METTAMAALDVSHLTKRYGRLRALRDVTFSVGPGEVFGYLGPNGAGKTTTLRIVMGLVRPDGGWVRMLGDSANRAQARERVGYLPGEMHLYEGMPAGALLDHFARSRPRRPPVLRERLVEALALSEPDLSRRIKWLSHGTRQKVGLALAMQHDPDLLLLDEPTTGLDPLVQHGFRELIRELAARGRAVLFSSHVLSEVEAVCGRVGVLRAGELLAVESIDALRARLVRRLEVRFRDAAPPDLGALPGITRAEVSGANATLWLRGDVNPLLAVLARRPVEHLVFPEPQLEDVFLDLYRQDAP